VSEELQDRAQADRPGLRDIATDAVRYWERRRLVYNALLVLIVIWCFVAGLPGSLDHFSFDLLLVLFVLGVVANVLYCLAYVADLFVQLSAARGAWLRWRWVLFLVGMATAAIMARFIATNTFQTWRCG
jgi:hypothetical protein